MPNSQRDGLVAAWVGCAGWEGCGGWVLAAAVVAGSGGVLGGRVPEPAPARAVAEAAAAVAVVAAAPDLMPPLPVLPGVDPVDPLSGSTMTWSGDRDALRCGGAGGSSPGWRPAATITPTSAAAPVAAATASWAPRAPDRRCRALLTSDLQVAPVVTAVHCR